MNAKIKTSKADSSQHSHAQTFRTPRITFGARDEPDTDSSDNKTERVPIARKTLRKSGYDGRYGGAHNGGHRRDQSHISAGQ